MEIEITAAERTLVNTIIKTTPTYEDVFPFYAGSPAMSTKNYDRFIRRFIRESVKTKECGGEEDFNKKVTKNNYTDLVNHSLGQFSTVYAVLTDEKEPLMVKFTITQDVTYGYLLFLYTTAYKKLYPNTRYHQEEVELGDLYYCSTSSLWVDLAHNAVICSFDCE